MQIALIVIYGITCFFVKSYFPSYMGKKGENLATKEDIAAITRNTEEVTKEFKEEFELFATDVRFKYDFSVRQYSELYCKLYAIVIQSEYIRSFIEKLGVNDASFDEAPFVQIGKTERKTKKTTFANDSRPIIEEKTEKFETDLSRFNKKALFDCIIEKGELASQELLKLAVSYRFAYEFYAGNENSKGYTDFLDTANNEEFRLIRELVCCIVREYNILRKELKLPYDKDELETGIPHC